MIRMQSFSFVAFDGISPKVTRMVVVEWWFRTMKQ